MWVFTTGGFISAVEHRDDHSQTMIRARDKMSLEEFLSSIRKGFVEAGKTEEEAAEMVAPWNIYAVLGDYKWRVVVPKSALGVGLAYEATHMVNYSNFKSKLTATRGTRWHDAAMKVWSAMFAITDTQKTGNPDVDNPKSYSSYHGIGSTFGTKEESYPASPKGKSGGKHAAQGQLDSGIAAGSEDDWMDDAVGMGYYDAYGSDGKTYRWGGNGLFEEDLEGYEDPDESRWSDGLHGFNQYDIDGRADIIDGEIVEGMRELSGDEAPTDAELMAVEEAISEAWEQWDEETEFNTITGETRSKIVDPLFDADYKFKSSVHSMTDAEWTAMQLAEGYAEQ